MPATPPAPTYDVFISYSHTDQTWVWEWLIPRLKAAGLAVCTDRESFEIGVPSLINMENAVAASRHTLLVLTPAYLASEWTMYEQTPDADPGPHRPAPAHHPRPAPAMHPAHAHRHADLRRPDRQR